MTPTHHTQISRSGKSVSPASAYRPEIDGLRAIAVLSVIASHAGEPFSTLAKGGFLGVDIFFVLSGFLITGILAREVSRGEFSLFHFYERRIRRILPALALVVLASIPVAWVLLPPNQMVQFAQSLVALTVFASNIYFWLTSNYFAPDAELLPMIHTWSLAVEEQFYVLFPLVFLGLWRWKFVLYGLCLLLVLGLVTAGITEATGASSAAFYLLPSRAWELLAGSLAGYCVAKYGLPDKDHGPVPWRLLGTYRNPLASIGLAGVAASIFLFTPTYHMYWLVLSVVSTTLLLLCVQRGSFVYGVLTRRVMIGIGLISYSAYLWHQPVFAFARLAGPEHPSALIMTVLIGAVLLLAWSSWYFVEKPFRSPRIKFVYVGSGLFTAMTLAGLFGAVGVMTSGLKEERFPDEVVAAFDSMQPSPMRQACHDQPPETACVYNSELPTTVAVFGDSHGVEFAYGLAGHLKADRHSVMHLTWPGCPPALFFATNVANCTDWTNEALDHLEQIEQQLTVILVYRHVRYISGATERIYPEMPDSTSNILAGTTNVEKRTLYWNSFEALVTRLRAAGHRVILAAASPEIGRSADRVIMHHLRSGTWEGEGTVLHVPAVPRQYYDALSGPVNAQLETIAQKDPGILFFDTTDVFCDELFCYAVRDGQALYYDTNHPSLQGIARMMRHFPRLGEMQHEHQ